MKNAIAKTTAIAALALAGLLAVPAAATAYVPAVEASESSATVTPGGTVAFSVTDGAFEPVETVTLAITGEGASSNSLAAINPASETKVLGDVKATDNGGVAPVEVRFGADARGLQVISATSESNPDGVRAGVTIVGATNPTTAPAEGVNIEAEGTPGTLPPTGMSGQGLLGAWVGGGLALLAGFALVIGVSVRRARTAA